IRYTTHNQVPSQNTYVQRNDVFLNYDFHSELSSLDMNNLQGQLKIIIEATNSFLTKAQWLIITYGTAWAYERNDTAEIVANCHKMPQGEFTKVLLTQKKILESFEGMFEGLKAINPDIKIILTVSPVRHLKDTLELNSVSKSILRTACHTLTEQYKDVDYFPAFEIMMDDLRDYRFYKPDMIHPSEIAEEYIWQKFSEKYFDGKLKAFLIRWKEIQSALAHKPFHPSSTAHQQFLRETLKKLEELKSVVNVDQEIEVVKSEIN
ncbi:MAG TPA: GSCFA domain-containing protein, partial [Chryseolinea sp.]|nr:GSCFA domain-containing protein [Chryseolinea sp.]